MSQSGLVLRIAPGTTLFLFNFETKNLHGIFEATSPGGLDLDPSAFKARSSAGFPAQVWVRLRHDCTPLHESVFKDAIRANYFSPTKFSFELSVDQVSRLLHLYSVTQPEAASHHPPSTPYHQQQEVPPGTETYPHSTYGSTPSAYDTPPAAHEHAPAAYAEAPPAYIIVHPEPSSTGGYEAASTYPPGTSYYLNQDGPPGYEQMQLQAVQSDAQYGYHSSGYESYYSQGGYGARSQQNPGPSSPVPQPPVARTDLRTVLVMKHSAERQRAERGQSESGELERSSDSPEQGEGRQSEEERVEELERGTESPEPRRRSIFERLGDADSARSVRSGSGTPSDGPRAVLVRGGNQISGSGLGHEAFPRGSNRSLETDGSGGEGGEATREGKRTQKVSPVSSRLSLREETGQRREERKAADERSRMRQQSPNTAAVQGRMVTGSGHGGHVSGGSRAAASEDLKQGGGVVRLQPATMGDILRGKASGGVTGGRGDGNGLGGKQGGAADSGLKGSEGGKVSRGVAQSGGERGAIGVRKRALEEGEIASEGSEGAAGERKVTGGGVAGGRKMTGEKAGGLEGSRFQKRGREEGRAERGEEAKKAKRGDGTGEGRGRADGEKKGEKNEIAAGGLGTVKDREKPTLKVSGGEGRLRDDSRRADGSEVRERERMPTGLQEEPDRKEAQAVLARPLDGGKGNGVTNKSGERATVPRERDDRPAPRQDDKRRTDGGRDAGKGSEVDKSLQRDARRSPSPRGRGRQVERGADRPAQRDARRTPSRPVRERQVERNVRKPLDRGGRRSPRASSPDVSRPHLRGRDTERERQTERERRREFDDRRREGGPGGARSHQQSAGRRPEGEAGARAPGGTPSDPGKGATSARHGHESGRESGQAGKGLYDRELERRRSEKGHSEVVRPRSAEGKREGESQARGNGSKGPSNAASPGAGKDLAGQGRASGSLPRGVVFKPPRDCEVGKAPVEGRGVGKESGLPSEASSPQERNAKPAAEPVAAPKSEDRGTGAMSGVREVDSVAEWRGLVEIEAKRSNGTVEGAVDKSGGLSGRLEKPAMPAELATGGRKVLAAETEQPDAREEAAAPVGGSASEQVHAGKVEETEEVPRGLSGEAASAAGVGVSAVGEGENGADENVGELLGDDLGADFLQLEMDVDEPLPEPEPARKASITPFFLTLSETF
ncbi:hypothetical protein KFL_001480140 [Klebsormidium nitens]|uniref:DCD domain-containing protein n=1 Tax=Klebsormidium nitens TaxID=105231 RepID=A0A1Y1HXS5_KLENI|nr:hypothetical protein KFL_001480140 [Klebsormidium nitens]|eukprot:GAQ83445.1 hypothetical protein KFL_001480140 [Klebsormidium nitens]